MALRRLRLHAMAASTVTAHAREMGAARMLIQEARSGARGMILQTMHCRSRRKTSGVRTLGNVVISSATSSAKTIQERGTCSAQSSLAGEAPQYDRWEKGGGNVHRSALLDPSVVVEVGGVVHAGAVIGACSHVGSGCVVGPNVSVGSSVVLRYNVALQNCSLGDSCIIHSGVCIGQDGFGFTVNDLGEVVKKPQELQVKIGNNVEIGANTCIDRGSWRDTVIGDHTKIDNLVQIGHNVIIGRCCMICGQVGIAGSCTLGDYVVLGGQAGMADHVSIVSKVRIAAKSGVISDISKPGDYAGFPAMAAPLWRRSMVAIRKLGGKASELDETHTTKVDEK